MSTHGSVSGRSQHSRASQQGGGRSASAATAPPARSSSAASVTSARSRGSAAANANGSHAPRAASSSASVASRRSSASAAASAAGSRASARSGRSLQEKLARVDAKSREEEAGTGGAAPPGPASVRSRQSQSARSARSLSARSASARSVASRSTRASAASSRGSARRATSPVRSVARSVSGMSLSGASRSRASSSLAEHFEKHGAEQATQTGKSLAGWSAASRSSVRSRSSTARASNQGRSEDSVSSQLSAAAFRDRGPHAEGVAHLVAGRPVPAIQSFTRAIQRYEGRTEPRAQRARAALHVRRATALHALGAHRAAARDAGLALACERGEEAGGGRRPYAAGGPSPESLQGVALRAQARHLRGESVLRGGSTAGVAEDFKAAFQVAEMALEDAMDLTDKYLVEKKSLRDSMAIAKKGLVELKRYEDLKAKLDGNCKQDYRDARGLVLRKQLDEALKIAPGAVQWHVAKVQYLVERRRWMAAAYHCERLAADAARWDGAFGGDLVDVDPSPGTPPLQALDPHFFVENAKGDTETPHYLRVLSPEAARDAAFRLPQELLPYYLRALRLEERHEAAAMAGAGATLAKSPESTRSYAREREKLEKTRKLMEEGDAQFRDACYDRAVALYGECLACDDIDDGSGGSTGSILRPASSWPTACTKAHEAGGRLHAVLHVKRAACFAEMGRHADAVKEASHALVLHPMHMTALLRRARSRAQLERQEEAKSDFGRYVLLAESARKFPYPPENEGSPCYFDMPSEVTDAQLAAAKSEKEALGTKPDKPAKKKSGALARARSRSPRGKKQSSAEKKQGSTKTKTSRWSCCSKSAASQVVEPSKAPALQESSQTLLSQSTSS